MSFRLQSSVEFGSWGDGGEISIVAGSSSL